MNYLAHLSLAYPDPGLIAGNYIADLINRKEEKNLHKDLISGVLFHRWIDDFSNNSEALSEINRAFHSLIHKYAPVASDIICDYLLILSWEQHVEIPFTEFSEYNYKTLLRYSELMPERVSIICKNMVRHKWLEQYQSLAGLEQVLKRTNQKTRFLVDLTLVLPVLIKNQERFVNLFNEFYSECKMRSKEWLNLQNELKR
jgi:acyl carrier protein phosphodiesterase